MLERAELVERAIAEVLEGRAENDPFNQLLVAAALAPRDVVLFRAWFRYLRQGGLSYSMVTVVEALRRAPGRRPRPDRAVRRAPRSEARGPARGGRRGGRADDHATACRRSPRSTRTASCACSAASSRRPCAPTPSPPPAARRSPSSSTARWCPTCPQPLPWREIWVYSPRVEGIHLRGGPIARGGLRWSDRRDDFRTEILGLMKAQLVKNAVIVPTGAKGGFYPKQLPPIADRDAWLAEGTESYRIFIRALLSVTDNIVGNKVVHPDGIVVRDGDDPYFVVAADKGTATFSDVANAIATERGFWLGDAFASGGSYGYDHKAMGITARGAWISVQRHFREIGIDVQTQPIRVAGVGDMSGDVFGNGMLLSKAIKLVAAFDHRHIFLDPDPDPAKSWEERKRLFELPRSSWDDYDRKLISKGGGIFPRSQKSIPLSPEIRALLGLEAEETDPATLITAILSAPVDLLWFGGIGTYIKARSESNAEVGDPANDPIRVNGGELRAKAIGEGANLAITQAGRIEFASRAGGSTPTSSTIRPASTARTTRSTSRSRSTGRWPKAGSTLEDRNALLAEMTDEVAGDRARGQPAADAGAVDRRARRRRRPAAAAPGDRDARGAAAASTAPSRASNRTRS